MRSAKLELRLHDWRRPLPSLHLGVPLRPLSGGTHKPLLCQLEDDNGLASLWVVKTPSMFSGMTTPLLREMIGADLFSALGLPSPQAGLVRIPATFATETESEVGEYAGQLFARDAGKLAFCSAYVDAPVAVRSVFKHPGRMKGTILEDAVTLYVGDRFFWHGDRTVRNPNCLRVEGRLVPIDHDRILARVSVIDEFGLGPDLDGDQPTLENIVDHVAADLVGKHPRHPRWSVASEAVALLTEEPLLQMAARWPDEWDRAPGSRSSAGVKDDVLSFLRHRVPKVVTIVKGFHP